MRLDIPTLALIQCLIFVTEVIVLFVQYRVNRAYHGVGWWVLGSAFSAVGVIFMPLVTINSLLFLAKLANPLLALGQIFIYVGISKFIETKENKWILISVFAAFIFTYNYYIYAENNLTARTISVSAILAVISMMAAYKLFLNKNKYISETAKFTAAVFFVYGCFMLARVLYTILMPPANNYSDLGLFLVFTFILPTVASILWTFGFIVMVNQRLSMDNLAEKEKMYQIFNISPDAALITRLNDGLIIDVNAGFTAMTGHAHDEVIGKSTLTINLWSKKEERDVFRNLLNEEKSCESVEFVFVRKDGSRFNGTISAKTIMINDEPHAICSIHDITNSKQAAEALRESEETYRSILNASPDDITITDIEGHILIVSPASKRMFGYEQDFEESVGLNLVDFILPEEVERARSNLKLMYQGNHPKTNEYHGVRKDKSIFDIEVNSGFIRNANGEPTKMVFVIRDITERKKAEQQIQQLVQQLEIERNIAQLSSITDSLTGIANRRYFDETLKTEFYRLKRSGAALSLIMLDVDYFKKFNDTYGHLAGDDCLRQIGNMLKTIDMRTSDLVARYGGEEFVVILPETEKSGVLVLAERIRKATEALSIPHSENKNEEKVTVSLGSVTVYPSALEKPEQVVGLADKALYCAKKGGRNRIEFIIYNENLSNSLLEKYNIMP